MRSFSLKLSPKPLARGEELRVVQNQSLVTLRNGFEQGAFAILKEQPESAARHGGWLLREAHSRDVVEDLRAGVAGGLVPP